MLFPTNAGLDKLTELKWNFDAQNAIIGINQSAPVIPRNQFTRIVNGLFFDADDTGLRARHIKWIDFIPIQYDDSGETHDRVLVTVQPYENLVEADANYVYPLPEDFKYAKLPRVNWLLLLLSYWVAAVSWLTALERN